MQEYLDRILTKRFRGPTLVRANEDKAGADPGEAAGAARAEAEAKAAGDAAAAEQQGRDLYANSDPGRSDPNADFAAARAGAIVPSRNCLFAGMGAMTMAQASALLAVVPQQRLTAFAVGYGGLQTLIEEATFIAPEVPVGLKFDYVVNAAANEFAAVQKDILGPDGLPQTIRFDPDSTASDVLQFRGLEAPIMRAELVAADGTPGDSGDRLRQRRIARLMSAIRRGVALRVIAQVQTDIAATNVTWDSSTDPLQPLDGYVLAAADEVGGVQNVRLLWGSAAWSGTKWHAKIIGDRTTGVKPFTFSDVMELIGAVPANCKISYALANTAKQGQTVSKARMWTNTNVLIYGCQQNANQDDPSLIKRFTMQEQGQSFWVYTYNPHPLVEKVGIAYWECIKTTKLDGAVRLVVAFS